jgi:outer membrane protein assembly factor BamB
VQLDLDFGASPNLFRDASGHELVGAMQKAGVYHAVSTSTMQAAWSRIVGVPCFSCNGASTAADGSAIYAAASPPGQMVSLTNTGLPRWIGLLTDPVHYESVSVAEGVVYTIDDAGNLDAFTAGTGLPILRHPIALDTRQNVAGVMSSGVAIARDTVYVADGSFLIAYR